MNSDHFSVSFPGKGGIPLPDHAEKTEKEQASRLEEGSLETTPSLAQLEKAERKADQKKREDDAELSALKNIGQVLLDEIQEESGIIGSQLGEAAGKVIEDEKLLRKEEA